MTSHLSSTSHSLFRNDSLVSPVHRRVGVAAMAEVDSTKTVGVTRVNSLDMDNYLKPIWPGPALMSRWPLSRSYLRHSPLSKLYTYYFDKPQAFQVLSFWGSADTQLTDSMISIRFLGTFNKLKYLLFMLVGDACRLIVIT